MSEKQQSEPGREPGGGRTFDPRPYLRTIQTDGRSAEYLDVKWRLAWLRTEHPDARITTEHIMLDEHSAVFRAMVQIPNGGCATGYGSETRSDWVDFIEKAETKAIGRALAALGYGTQFALDFDFDVDPGQARIVDSPVELDAARSRKARAEGERSRSGSGGRSRQRMPGDRAEWDEFWRWAKPMGYQNLEQLEELFGYSLAGMTPREVREQLTQYRQRHGLDEGESESE